MAKSVRSKCVYFPVLHTYLKYHQHTGNNKKAMTYISSIVACCGTSLTNKYATHIDNKAQLVQWRKCFS